MPAVRRYRVHLIEVKMTQGQAELERFLNDLSGEVVAIIPNVTKALLGAQVDFLLVIERVAD